MKQFFISAKKAEPQMFQKVLAVGVTPFGPFAIVLEFHHTGWWSYPSGERFNFSEYITHWQPLIFPDGLIED